MNETILEFQARAARRLAEHDERIKAPLVAELRHAKRSINALRAALTIERERARNAVAAVEELTRSARVAGPGREWFTAIVAELQVKRALGVALALALVACGDDLPAPSCDTLDQCHNIVCDDGGPDCYCGDNGPQAGERCMLPPPRVPTCAELGCPNTLGGMKGAMSTCMETACVIDTPLCSDVECTPSTCVASNGVHFTCQE